MSKISAPKSRSITQGNRLLGKIASSALGLSALASFLVGIAPEAKAASGTWITNNTGTWSGTANWAGGIIADGAGATADFTTIDITANRTVTIDTTSRTLGNLLLGDSGTAAFSNYTIAASGGASLIFDNGGSSALLNQAVISGANTVSAPITLNDNLSITNSSTNALTISGTIAGAKVITNSGTGVGGVNITGVLSSNVAGVVQNSASSILTLSGSNTFSTGVQIKSGSLGVTGNFALGSGTVTLGDTSGTADATFLVNTGSFTNSIVVQAGSGSNTLTILANGNVAARPNGNILLNNNLTMAVNGGAQSGRSTGAYLASSGTISGTGNLTLDVSGAASTTNNSGQPQLDSLALSGPVTTSGTIFNTGTGSGRAIISGNISNASGLNQNSATSMLSLSGSNTYTGPTNVNAGVLRITSLNALPASNTVTVASGATLELGANSATSFGATVGVNISGTGTAYSYGALEAYNTSNFAGAVVLQGDSLIASDLFGGNPATLTLSGGITGAGKALTVGGAGNTVISGAIATGTGSFTKLGSGLLTLSGSNSFTGLTTVGGGTILLNNAGALNGGGNITFDGGALRFSSSNTLDLGSRVVNSTSSVSLDTNSQNVTASNIDASNTAGLTKLGLGRLTLSGTNSFSGPVAVNGGVLAVSSTTALPSVGTGLIFLDKNGALNTGGAYSTFQAWLDSGNIATNSTGVIALTSGTNENIDFSAYSNLGLGASTSSTYTGSITPAGSTYRLGGGGATLTLSGNNALTGSRALVVSAGAVTLSGSNNLSGATTVTGNTLTLSSTLGSLGSSDISVNAAGTLAFTANSATAALTRASSVTLSRSTLTVAGNATTNSNDVIANALTIASGGNSTVTLTPNAAKNTLLTSGSLTRNAGGIGLLRGTSLGVNTLASQTANSVNIAFNTTPTLSGTGVGGTTAVGILAGFIGDTTTGGTGLGATGGLLTYDATNGVRLLSAAEYKTSITSGQTQLDNILLSATTAGVATTTLSANTTVNSLSIKTSTIAGAGIAIAGTGTLTVSSGVIYNSVISPANLVATVGNDIDFNGKEAIILTSGTGINFSGALTNTGGNGLTLGGPGRTVFSGTTANTYTGTTTLNAGVLQLSKTTGTNAIAGDVVINTGATLTSAVANQIADTASIFVNGGLFDQTAAETVKNVSLTNAGSANFDATTLSGDLTITGSSSVTGGSGRIATVAGTVSLSDGGSIEISRSQSITGVYDSVFSVNNVNITNSTSGGYTAITIDTGGGLPQSGGKLTLNGDLTFTGNSTNTNTVLIDATKGSGRQGVVELNGTRTFDIGNGAAKVDFRITAGMVDGASTGGLTKNGQGTLDLTGASTYTGNTTVNAGTLLINGTSVSAATVAGGILGGNGTISNSVSVGGSGTIAAGNSTVGTLNTGAFSLTGGTSTIAMEIGGASSYDNINVTGAVNLSGNGRIVVSLLAYVPTVSDLYFVVLNDGVDAINGTLFGLAQGATFASGGYTWRVGYTGDSAGQTFTGGNDLVLQVVPEPQTWALMVGGATMLMIFRRRSSRS